MYPIQGGDLRGKEDVSTVRRYRRHGGIDGQREMSTVIRRSRKRGGDLERKEQISKSNERSRRQRGDLKDEQDEHV